MTEDSETVLLRRLQDGHLGAQGAQNGGSEGKGRAEIVRYRAS